MIKRYSVYILVIFLVVFFLAFTNYIPGTYLVGWDSLQTEFAPLLGIKRAIFSVWEEYQGLGLLAGMGHAADLVRAVFIFLMSLVLPQSLVRYTFQMIMTFIGAVGMFNLLLAVGIRKGDKMLALLGSLFYIFNFGSIQINFLPFETFTVFFAMLPWEIWIFFKVTSEKYIHRKSLLLFFLINFLATPHNLSQQLFVVYFLILGLISFSYLFQKDRMLHLRNSLIALVAVLIINSFWLLPQTYFVFTHQKVFENAKINQQITGDIFYRNLEKGKLVDFITMKGFFYDTRGMDNHFLFERWKMHEDNEVVKMVILVLSLIPIVGIFYKSRYRLAFLLIYFLVALNLLIDFPLFSFLNQVLRSSELVNIIFRSPFTKFIIPYALVASYFFVAGVAFILEKILIILPRQYDQNKLIKAISLFLFILILIRALPSFQGYHISPEMKVKIPQEYLEVMDYLKLQDKSKRVSLLPDYTFWGWFYNRWGYNGSGFIWYGIEQPIISRNFDYWSDKSEDYFWEAKGAVDAGDAIRLKNVLDKYSIDYLLIDYSLLPVSGSFKGLKYDQLNKILNNNEYFSLVKKWENIALYIVSRNAIPLNFVFLADNLPIIGPEYKWNNLDKAYTEYGNYISLPINGTPKNSYLPPEASSLALVRGESTGQVIYDKGYEEYGNYITINQNAKVKSQNDSSKIKSEDNIGIELLLGFFGYTIRSYKQENNNYKKNNDDPSQDIDNRNGTGHILDFPFMPRVSEKCDNHAENKNGYANNKIISNKGFIHRFLDSSALLVKNILNIQQVRTSITPIIAMIKSNFSSPVTSGDNTTAPKNTWPALSSILANLKYSPSEKGNPFGKGLIKTIYAKDNIKDDKISTFDVYYPFRSLFTGRKQEELEFKVGVEKDNFIFRTAIPKELVGYKLVLPTPSDQEVTELDENDLSIKSTKTPQIYLDGEFIPYATDSANTIDLPYIKVGSLEVKVPKINGYYSYDIDAINSNLEPKSCDQFNEGTYTHEKINTDEKQLLRLTSVGSSNCVDFDLPNLSQDIGYLVTIQNRNIEGKSLLFSVINKNSQRADIETYLPNNKEQITDNKKLNTSYFIIPPMEQYGLGYALHLDNISIGRVKAVNDLGRITVNPIPYRFLTGLKIVQNSSTIDTFKGSTFKGEVKVEHPNPSLYQVVLNSFTLSPTNNVTLVLSQSFDSGWHAYDIKLKDQNSKFKTTLMQLFPFWFGNEIKDHVLVNNWENGWQISNSSFVSSRLSTNNPTANDQQPTTIIIVYLPQYLEYIGFILLGIGILVVIFYPQLRSKDQPLAETNN